MLLLIPVAFIKSGHLAAGISAIGALLLMFLVIRFEKFDVLAQMEKSQNMMQDQKDMMIHKGKKLDEMYAKVQDPANVWIYRTRPKLDVLCGLCKKFTGNKWPDVAASSEFLDTCLLAIEELNKGYGPLDLWQKKSGNGFQEPILGMHAMKLLRHMTDKAAKFIKGSSVRDVKAQLVDMLQVPKLLVVRVRCCRDLPKGTLLDDYDPYVRLRAKADSKWLKTEAFENEQNPNWTDSRAEFRFMLRTLDTTVLEVEVMDENDIGSDTYIGGTTFPFNEMDCNGRWKILSKTLPDAEQGEVEIEVFYCGEASGLLSLMPAPPPVVIAN